MRHRSPEARRAWWRTSAFAFALVLPGWFVFEPYSTWACGDCGSRRRESQMRVGPSRDCSIPLAPMRERIDETDAARLLLGPGHEHRWTFAQGADGYVFIRWGLI